MTKSRFSFTRTSEDLQGTTLKENRDALRESGLSASTKNNGDGTVEFRISGDEETVSAWRRMMGN
jgi:acylphosphatase